MNRGLLAAPLLLALTACSSAQSAPAESIAATSTSTSAGTATTATPPTTVVDSTTSTAASTSTSTPPSTTAPADPSYLDTPIGTCDTIAPGAIGFRNETGNLADAYMPIGTSYEGRTIWAEHWGSHDGPQVLVLGQVHGDECAPAWFVQAIREQPPTTFGIWLVPTVNPDGLAAHTRLTAQGIDPNRDGFNLETPEARAVMAVTAAVQPVLTIHCHSPYHWVGEENEGLALEAAKAMSEAAGWGGPRYSGRVEHDNLAFLWEGQENVIPAHPTVLIEFPAVAEAESPAPPDLSQKVVTSVDDVAAVAVAMRDALYGLFG
ncbi:MAG: hypothetical protein KDB06_11320 [Ilumatobacter sp.]|nr:hypothetical protein [Ilumatobacter sp.]